MSDLGRTLIGIGLLLVVLGGVLVLLPRAGVPLGRLPGDITYRSKSFSFFAPLGTSILLSIVLSLVLYLLARLRR